MQKFTVGSILQIENTEYIVIGSILYRNTKDYCTWYEYRLRNRLNGDEAWLSIDDCYKEYSISFMTKWADDRGFHKVDEGTEVVLSRSGSVDVDLGEKAFFIEYEDETEEQIISVEKWSDGDEVSTGHYLDEDEIQFVGIDKSTKFISLLPLILCVCFFGGIILFSILTGFVQSLATQKRISKYLKKETIDYSFVTAETGMLKTEALIYKSDVLTLDNTAVDIIQNIEGDTEYVQKDTTTDENGSIAILTKDEYCLIYESEDGTVYIQVSPRKYTYCTDTAPYHSTARTHSYYRSFYRSTGYNHDSSSFKGDSPYSNYSTDGFSYTGDSFSSYSRSVRQSSINARNSSSGGISAGK